MQRLFLWAAEKLRPWHERRQPELLRHPPSSHAHFHRGAMMRAAGLSVSQEMTFGIFELIGAEFARRASRAWWPRELLLMEDLSLAFFALEEDRKRSIEPAADTIDRLVAILGAYFEYIGKPLAKPEVRALVSRYLSEHADTEAAPRDSAWPHVAVNHPLLRQLQEFDQGLAAQGSAESLDLGNVGLYLDSELDQSRYAHCTPNNCRTFATTGGDGVHFSLLIVDGSITEASPVVMTTPADTGESVVLGDSLFEFLCLGCLRGYFALETLGSGSEQAISPFLNPEWTPTEKWQSRVGLGDSEPKCTILERLRARFQLRPWQSAHRLVELQESYAGLLKKPPV